jgi:hypothetical protein
MEYLMITGIAFMLLIPIILIAYTQSASFAEDVAAAQVQKIGQEIIDGAHEVWYTGPPAKTTRMLYFPDHIQAITISGQTLAFTMSGTGGSYEYAVFSDANLTGSLGTFNGLHRITIEATEDGPVNITEG